MQNIYIYLLLAVMAFSAGVYTEHEFKLASETKALYASIGATEKAQEQANDTAGTSATLSADIGSEGETIREDLYAEESKTPVNCDLPDSSVKLLIRSAENARHPAGRVHH